MTVSKLIKGTDEGLEVLYENPVKVESISKVPNGVKINYKNGTSTIVTEVDKYINFDYWKEGILNASEDFTELQEEVPEDTTPELIMDLDNLNQGDLILLDNEEYIIYEEGTIEGSGSNTSIANYLLNGDTTDKTGRFPEGEILGGVTFEDDSTFGKVAHFDGKDGTAIKVGTTNFDCTDTISISLWVKLNTTDNWQTPFIFSSEGGDNAMNSFLHVDDSKVGLRGINSDGDSIVKDISLDITTDKWHHLVYTSAGNFYWDNESIGSLGEDIDINNFGYDFLIGCDRDNDDSLNDTINGSIANVKIFDHNLSIDEIDYDYNNPLSGSFTFNGRFINTIHRIAI